MSIDDVFGTGIAMYGAAPDPIESPRVWAPYTPSPTIGTTTSALYIGSIWETAGNCPSCGGPIYSRRDPAKPSDPPEVRRNCTRVCQHDDRPRTVASVHDAPAPKRCAAVIDACRCGAVISQPRCPCDHSTRVVCESCSACRDLGADTEPVFDAEAD